MKGLHEPLPRIVKEASQAWKYNQRFGKIWYPGLAGILKERLELDTPIIVDHKCSLVIPVILEVDPDAEFIWLIRDPADCIRSSTKINMYNRKKGEHYEKYRLTPLCGFPDYYNPLDKNIWRYWAYNTSIAENLKGLERSRWQLLKSEDLDNWNTVREYDDPFGPGDLQFVERTLRQPYVEWLKLAERT